MKIVGLAGKAGSGKSYLADQILVPAGFLPLSLAGPMKSQLAAEGVIPADEATGRASKGPRTRRVLQVFGTELGRGRFYEDVWCVRLEWWLSWFLNHGITRFVVPDVRFQNEVLWIQDMSGLVLRVTGRGGLEGEAAEHPSETDLDGLDLPEIDNSPGRGLDDIRSEILTSITEHYRDHPEPEPDL